MEKFELAHHTYVYRPGQPTSQDVFVLLHGTGGDERSIIDIGNLIDPTAHLIGVRGNVQENGLYRYFKRHREGVYDIKDLGERTSALADFITQAIQHHQLQSHTLTIIGYSNGANIAISLILNQPNIAHNFILFRPLFPYQPDKPLKLPPINVLLLPGNADPMATENQNITLANMLSQYGASVTTKYINASHGLADQDLEVAQNWCKMLSAGSVKPVVSNQ